MSVDKILAWASSGSLATESEFETVRQNGFLDEQVPYPLFNKIENRQDVTIEAVRAQVATGLAEDAGIETFITGLFGTDDCAHSTGSDYNRIDTGDTSKEYYDISLTKIGTEKKILAANYATGCEVDVLDILSQSLESENDLSTGLPTAGTEDWRPVGICNDGTYCYVLFQDADASPEVYRVQSYELADWSVNGAWPAEGLALTGSGAINLDVVLPKIIIAASGKLAVLQSWATISAGTSPAVAIIDATDGTLDGEGAGGVTLTSSTKAKGLGSDGTYVYFGVIDTSSQYIELASMAIANPGANGYSCDVTSAGIVSVSNYVGALCCAGNEIVIGFESDTSDILAMTFVFDGSNLFLNNLLSTAVGGATAVRSIAFDGLNFWAIGIGNPAFGDPSRILRLDFCRSGGVSSLLDTPPTHETDYKLYEVNYDPASGAGPDDYLNAVIHDGRDLWCVHALRLPDARAGVLVRFTRTLLR